MKKGELKKGILSFILTSIIIATLVLVAPAGAVEVSISTDKNAYKTTEVVTFNFNIDIEDQENVPFKYLILKINGIEKCRFNVDGSIISGCENMIITPTLTAQFGYGYRQATGFGNDGTTIGNKHVIYGYGYGYGYAPLQPSELKYEVKWTTTDSDFGKKNAVLETFAENEEQFTYISNTATFNIHKGPGAEQANADIAAEKGEVIMEDGTFGSNAKDSIELFADLRSIESEVGGTIALNADLYTEEGKHRTIELRLKPKILNDFHRDLIEVEGLSRVIIKTTQKGEKNQKVVDDMHTIVTVDINAKTVKVTVLDDDMPFTVEDMQIKTNGFNYREFQKSVALRKGIPTQLVEVFRLSF